jgi:lipid-binding SYLF domain-containing protein
MIRPAIALIAALLLPIGIAQAAGDTETVSLFKQADESSDYFKTAYGYAVFPTIGKGGLGIGAAHGSGHVYEQGRRIGRVTMNQLSIGFQAGGKAYSEIIFFENKHALDEFTSGNFEFSGDVGAIVITASASASAGTTGENASASAGKHDAKTQGGYHEGMAVFTIAKGGLMYNATVAGQKFSFKPGRHSH